MDYSKTFKKRDLRDEEFKRLSSYIETNLGIRMPPAKKVMLESRLQKRLKHLGLNNFSEYVEYLFSKDGQELEIPAMIDVVTTNKTDFFREPAHFDYLREKVFPHLHMKQNGKPIMLWSAACSTGEEPYTLALEGSKFREQHPGFDFRIYATDISGEVLTKARSGIYLKDRLDPIPKEFVRKYFTRSKDPAQNLVRVKPELRALVSFLRLNLMDPVLPFRDMFDVVFCRNVMIYFDRDRQKFLLEKIARSMKPNGFLFLGHSETLTGMDVPFASVAATIYRRI